MSEFISRVEKFVEVEELVFPPTPGFGEYERFFPPEAKTHPAKANTYLIEFLVKRYSKPRDIVLDPMAGTGSTCVIAALLGRNAVCIDIEKIFVEWMKKAREILYSSKTLNSVGRIVIGRADARELTKYIPLESIDTVITSPPYGDIQLSSGDPQKMLERMKKAGVDLSKWRFLSPTCILYRKNYWEYDKDDSTNIGLLDFEGYLIAMRRVYGEIYRVLKKDGYTVIIVKAYRKRGEIVDLPWYTHILMDGVGFRLEKVYKFRVPTHSFWIMRYKEKYPNAIQINHEHILVYKK